jgi:hypothetical protein
VHVGAYLLVLSTDTRIQALNAFLFLNHRNFDSDFVNWDNNNNDPLILFFIFYFSGIKKTVILILIVFISNKNNQYGKKFCFLFLGFWYF